MPGFALPSGRPAVMGILNVTPDSFSDGGRFAAAEAAVDHGLQMFEEGADLVDVGGESTRPGADPVPTEVELARVVPVVERLSRQGVPVSVDTMKAEVAEACLDHGAVVVNDVSGIGSPAMRALLSDSSCSVCVMHMQGEPRTMQAAPTYANVVEDVASWLGKRCDELEGEGIARDRIWVDPGVGFGKTFAHNLALIGTLDRIADLGYPVLVGVSRKSFLGAALGGAPVEDRLEGGLAAQVLAQALGARIIRTHDPRQARRAIEVASHVLANSAVLGRTGSLR
ncbi:MAG: dihydropteroate synthase [Fimbriimonadaceae bacterium]|nr:dihydropteroate synthase [Fimbriimonadaceae bacterium]